ncbi:MAG: hypothetical protein H7235_11470 [Bdellovibrionaceae bacterium]|nr:hypothetical protein [Pseudobdellovibrionaceae bacterium]
MFLNQELLQGCEELFDQISNENGHEELNDAISSLRSFLEKDVDGFTHYMDAKLAYAVQSRLEEIWGMISRKEKKENPNLADAYQEILALTEDASGYEADDPDSDEPSEECEYQYDNDLEEDEE